MVVPRLETEEPFIPGFVTTKDVYRVTKKEVDNSEALEEESKCI